MSLGADTAKRLIGVVTLSVIVCLTAGAAAVHAQTPPWVEPRALNIVDIAGQVPDDALREAIVTWNGLAGISRFLGSRQVAAGLEIDVLMDTRRFWSNGGWLTRVPLLGQRPFADHMGSAAPESTLYLYKNGQPLTAEAHWINYLEPALTLPSKGAVMVSRYPELERQKAPPERDGLGIRIPANWGGELVIEGDHPVITGTFRIAPSNTPRVTYLGSQEATFQSFIGTYTPGDEGHIGNLIRQMHDHCGTNLRHPRIALNVPPGANYVLFIYPPTPVDLYDVDPNLSNIDRPTSGTLRLAPDGGMLSINLVHSGGFPLLAAWQDADQVKWRHEDRNQPDPPPAERFLSLLPPIDRFTPPEIFVPSGVEYHPCFREGACLPSLLDQVCNAAMPIRIVYLSVRAPTSGQTVMLPLRMADDAWAPASNGLTASITAPVISQAPYVVHLPVIARPPALPTPEFRPLGIFDRVSGRMVGYLP